jgi:hypothetical protein
VPFSSLPQKATQVQEGSASFEQGGGIPGERMHRG